ncbi:hypothetical protein [Herbaspirillum sp. ST 5-3]|uniref:hypothetical protein n=1 Tax=Oxalobacteraceae TaxID=75682 RepID=UPI0010A49B06|nr:hypothetical protein [Herbaspirillum sp. ST 5-3]
MSADSITLPSIIRSAHIRVSVYQGSQRSLSASLFTKQNGKMIAYLGVAPADECRVLFDDGGDATLWIGHAALDIPVVDAQRAAETLEIRLVDERVAPEAK